MIDTSNVRRDLWQAALRQWNLAPVFGTGSATYLYYGRLLRNPNVDRDPVYTHSDYLQLLADYGIIGGIAIGAVVVVHCATWSAQLLADWVAKRVAVSHLLFSNGLALNIGRAGCARRLRSPRGLSILTFTFRRIALLLAFVFAILANDGVCVIVKCWRSRRTDIFWRLTLSALAVALVVQSVRLFPGEYFSERARVAVRDNKPAVAILNATRGLQYDPKNPDLFDRLGQAWEAARRPERQSSGGMIPFTTKRSTLFTKARSLAPQDELYALDLATTLDAAKRFPEAEWNFYDALQLDPQSSQPPPILHQSSGTLDAAQPKARCQHKRREFGDKSQRGRHTQISKKYVAG